MVLQVLRLDIGPAIAGLGIVGLALSLGAQHLVRDYVAGAFVLIENQYAKGDTVTIAGVTGTVEDISLRRTTLRDIDGTLHLSAHGLIEVSSNLTRTWARVNLDLPVPYGVDVGRLAQIINEAGLSLADDAAWRGRVLEPPAFLRVGRFNQYGMLIKVLGTVSAVDRWEATGEMRRRIIEGAAAAGIEIGWQVAPATRGKIAAAEED
jgi:small conductance mechanosensitive channel